MGRGDAACDRLAVDSAWAIPELRYCGDAKRGAEPRSEHWQSSAGSVVRT